MSRAKLAITLDETILDRVDRLVTQHVYPNRSRAIEDAIEYKLERMERNRLAAECAKLEPAAEQALAEEGISAEMASWPEY